jgi:hypothetical protein
MVWKAFVEMVQAEVKHWDFLNADPSQPASSDNSQPSREANQLSIHYITETLSSPEDEERLWDEYYELSTEAKRQRQRYAEQTRKEIQKERRYQDKVAAKADRHLKQQSGKTLDAVSFNEPSPLCDHYGIPHDVRHRLPPRKTPDFEGNRKLEQAFRKLQKQDPIAAEAVERFSVGAGVREGKQSSVHSSGTNTGFFVINSDTYRGMSVDSAAGDLAHEFEGHMFDSWKATVKLQKGKSGTDAELSALKAQARSHRALGREDLARNAEREDGTHWMRSVNGGGNEMW